MPDDASPFPKRGLGTGNAFDELYHHLDRVGNTHLTIIDEIDHLEEGNTLLYELPRALQFLINYIKYLILSSYTPFPLSHQTIDSVRIPVVRMTANRGKYG